MTASIPRLRLFLGLALLVFLGSASIVIAQDSGKAGERHRDNDEEVVKSGTFNEDVFASGERVTVRAKVDGSIIVMGGEVDIASEVTGDILAMGGDLSAGTEIEGDAFLMAGNLDARGRVGGELTATGGNVDINAAIAGNALAMGGNLDIRNRINGDVKAAGGNIEADAQIGGNLWMVGGRVGVSRQTQVGGNLWAAGGRVDIDGAVGRELRAAGRDVTIGGQITGDAHIEAVELEILPTARFGGNLTYRSPTAIKIPDGVVVAGDVTFIQSYAPTRAIGSVFAAAGGVVLLVLVEFLILGALLVLIVPQASLGAAVRGGEKPWKALGIGISIVIVTPFLIALLLSTIIGIVIGVLAAALYFVTLLFGLVISALAVGRRSLRLIGREGDHSALGRIGLVAIGLLIIGVLAVIPVFGLLVVLTTLAFGSGSIALYVASRRQTV